MHDGNNIIVNDQSESSFCPIRQNSYDNEINNHGKRLLDICESAELKILNGKVWVIPWADPPSTEEME